MATRRVVSLVPSATETLAALGLAPVACTRFCERPDLLTVGGTKTPDVAAIVALAPDVVVMNDEENRRADYDAIRAAGLEVVDVSPRTVGDVGTVVTRLAAAVDRPVPPPFDRWPEWLSGRDAALDPRPARAVVTMVWRRPWMALSPDTYGASLLAALGLRTPRLGSDPGARYPQVDLDEVAVLGPAVVVLPSEPYAFAERHRVEVATAVPGADVRLVDGRDLFWWGIRTPAALTRLAASLA